MEYSIILRGLLVQNVDYCVVSWVHAFLTGRSFFPYEGTLSFNKHNQGFVLAPLPFSIVMSSSPLRFSISNIKYPDDVALFACA